MRKLIAFATAVVLSTGTARLVAVPRASSAEAFNQQVVSVALEGAPLRLSARVVSTARPAGVAFEAENTTNRVITDYGVRVYIYRHNGRALGFVTKHETEMLQPGGTHASIVSMSEMSIPPDAVVVITPTLVRFMDDSPRWLAPDRAQDLVKAEAARLTASAR